MAAENVRAALRADRLRLAAERFNPHAPGCWSALAELASALADYAAHDLVPRETRKARLDTPEEFIAWRNAAHPEPSDVELIRIRDAQWRAAIRALPGIDNAGEARPADSCRTWISIKDLEALSPEKEANDGTPPQA